MKRICKSIFLLLVAFLYIMPLQANQTNNSPCVKKILLVVAMEKEGLPIIDALGLKKSLHSFSNLPMEGYEGKYNNLDLFLILNGKDPIHQVQNVGTQAAALTTYLGIEYFHPDLVMSIGTAGGIAESGAKIGDIYASKKIHFYDRRIPFPGYSEYGMGRYDSVNYDSIINKLNIKTANLCSGDSFDQNQVDVDIILKSKCAAREMEAASVAWVSMLTHTPMLAIKGITDIEGSETAHEDFLKNFSMTNQRLAEKTKEFLNKL